MRNVVLFLALIAVVTSAESAKCRSQRQVIYTQDQFCPAGFTDITSGTGGSVSTIGKSANVLQLEQQYLASRAAESRQHQAQVAQQQQQDYIAAANLRGQCQSIDSQIRSIEIAMRQPNAWQQMDQLKQSHRALRDQQYQLGCHR